MSMHYGAISLWCYSADGNGNRPDLVPAWSLGKGVTQSRGDHGLHEASLACTQGQLGFVLLYGRAFKLKKDPTQLDHV